MGLPAQPDADLADVVQRLAYDKASRSSITGALVAARENARLVRHLLPADVWEALNVTYVELEPARALEECRRDVPVSQPGADPHGGHRRPDRYHHEPRPRLAVPDPGPLA